MVQVSRQHIVDALAQDRFLLVGQPKWTLGKNTCNTYEVFIDLMIDEHDQMGIRLVAGNFGTGYSTIDLLRHIPFDMLELSRDFTARITENERELRVTIAVLQMAQVLDLTVCAKGIETAEQMELLEHAGFYKGQGYLIGRPMPLDELEAFVRRYGFVG